MYLVLQATNARAEPYRAGARVHGAHAQGAPLSLCCFSQRDAERRNGATHSIHILDALLSLFLRIACPTQNAHVVVHEEVIHLDYRPLKSKYLGRRTACTLPGRGTTGWWGREKRGRGIEEDVDVRDDSRSDSE